MTINGRQRALYFRPLQNDRFSPRGTNDEGTTPPYKYSTALQYVVDLRDEQYTVDVRRRSTRTAVGGGLARRAIHHCFPGRREVASQNKSFTWNQV